MIKLLPCNQETNCEDICSSLEAFKAEILTTDLTNSGYPKSHKQYLTSKDQHETPKRKEKYKENMASTNFNNETSTQNY